MASSRKWTSPRENRLMNSFTETALPAGIKTPPVPSSVLPVYSCSKYDAVPAPGATGTHKCPGEKVWMAPIITTAKDR